MYNWGMISSLDRTLFIFRQNIMKDRNMHKTLVIYVCNISHTKRNFASSTTCRLLLLIKRIGITE